MMPIPDELSWDKHKPEFKTGPHSAGIRLTRSEASNKLKTFHFAPNLWQTTFMSSFLTEA